jgi:hypothetical protein
LHTGEVAAVGVAEDLDTVWRVTRASRLKKKPLAEVNRRAPAQVLTRVIASSIVSAWPGGAWSGSTGFKGGS